ncbi:MAG: DUF4831 family protein [Paludibacteraceae bacterium]|nr:DUF4831 family protein [Paludibacteraceae bacterium]
MTKKFFVLLGAVMVSSMMHAQQLVRQNEMALIYYAPKNYVVLDFEYNVEIREAGPYAKYAESLLGVTNAIRENSSSYVLNKVEIGSRTIADTTRAHKVVPEQGIPTQLLTLNNRGLLVGYNMPYEAKNKPRHQKNSTKPVVTYPESRPLTDEQLDFRKEEDRAKAIAKQIYRIRESRVYLLGGEVEHAPADGKAMQLVLEELKEEETQLVSLFTGRITTRTEHYEATFMPGENGKQDREEWHLFFSDENGFTQPENLDADTIIVRLNASWQTYKPVEVTKKNAKADKNAPQASQLVYNLPGSANITVTYRDKFLGSKVQPIAQFGIDVPLSRDLFTGATLPIIRFNTRTGNIESISK